MKIGGALAPLRRRSAALGQRLSLRWRLVLGLVLVAGLGLSLADIVVYGEVRPYLFTQVDQQLAASVGPMERAIVTSSANAPGGVPVGTFAMVLDPNGQVDPSTIRCIETLSAEGPCPKGPKIPAGLIARLAQSSSAEVLTIASSANSTVSRYQLEAVSEFDGGALVVAIPLTGVDGTLGKLLFVELVASAAVLLALVGLGYLVVRVGLRPLAEIEKTAGAIAAGDLGRRVARADGSTEVGRLGASLNSMLAQIEHAFTEQKASEDRLRQFLADASHELRTPVTSIRGYSELFRRGAQDRPEDLSLAMRRIEDEAIRMGGLVDDLLLLARLDQGRPLERALVDLAALATDAAADAQVLEPSRPILVEASQPVLVEGDEQRLRQVVTNLVDNALQHTPESTPLRVSVSSEADRAVLAVSDRGPGIASEHVGHVFERFYRADPSRTRASGGSGLGLSIVSSIASAHGGLARLVSELGEGSTFLVELPLAAAVPATDAGRPKETNNARLPAPRPVEQGPVPPRPVEQGPSPDRAQALSED